MNIQAKVEAKINAKLDALIDAAIEKAFGGEGDSQANLKAAFTPAPVVAADNSAVVQDLVDVARRFIRKSRGGDSASKKERNVGRRAIKAVKSSFKIVASSSDVWSRNGL